MDILIGFLIFWFGASVGFCLKAWLSHKFKRYGGVIIITKNEEKTLYSLELVTPLDDLEFETEIIFKVDTSGQNLNRS